MDNLEKATRKLKARASDSSRGQDGTETVLKGLADVAGKLAEDAPGATEALRREVAELKRQLRDTLRTARTTIANVLKNA